MVETELTEKQNNVKMISNSLATDYDARDKLEAELKEIKARIKGTSENLRKLMQEQDLETFRTHRGTFYINIATRARVVNPEAAFPYLKDLGCGAIIKEAVNHVTLSSTVRELCEQGKIMLTDLEDKGISVYVDESVRIRGRDKNGE